MKETETQKAIEAESDVYAKYDPFGDYKHLSISERSRLISAKTQAYMAGHIAGRSKSLEEKEKRVRELEEALRELVMWAKPDAAGRWNYERVIEKAEQRLSNH